MCPVCPVNPTTESVRDRVRRSHEQWFHFTKEPRYFCDIDPIREEHQHPVTLGRRVVGGAPENEAGQRFGADGGRHTDANPLGKLPDSVWTIATEPLIVPEWLGVDHFAAFPTEWPRRIITAWCPEHICTVCGEGRRSVSEKTHTRNRGGRQWNVLEGGPEGSSSKLGRESTTTIIGTACACPDTSAPTKPGIVLDPFGGTGTTAMVARALGRYGVSVDLSADYLRLAHWRIFDSGGAAKVRGRDNADRQGVLL